MKDKFNENDRSYSWPIGEKIATDPDKVAKGDKRDFKGGRREIRQVPFDEDTFREICKRFYVHSSISRVISRADVPLFSRAEVKMGVKGKDESGHSAIGIQALILTGFSLLTGFKVYNCRSANTWKDDLALTVTHFPHSKLTFAILFGCTLATEKQVINRIASANEHAFYPLILPGIFAELERIRIVEVVEATIDDIEGAIFELDSGIATREASLSSSEEGHAGGTRYVRRTVWLNTTFLRSRLQIWRTQLQKMIDHVDELPSKDRSSACELSTSHADDERSRNHKEDDCQERQTAVIIKNRLCAIIEEYDEKIGECSMRVDGMTIATQWVRLTRLLNYVHQTANSHRLKAIRTSTLQLLPGEIPIKCDPSLSSLWCFSPVHFSLYDCPDFCIQPFLLTVRTRLCSP